MLGSGDLSGFCMLTSLPDGYAPARTLVRATYVRSKSHSILLQRLLWRFNVSAATKLFVSAGSHAATVAVAPRSSAKTNGPRPGDVVVMEWKPSRPENTSHEWTRPPRAYRSRRGQRLLGAYLEGAPGPLLSQKSTNSRRPSPCVMLTPHHLRRTSR